MSSTFLLSTPLLAWLSARLAPDAVPAPKENQEWSRAPDAAQGTGSPLSQPKHRWGAEWTPRSCRDQRGRPDPRAVVQRATGLGPRRATDLIRQKSSTTTNPKPPLR